MKRMPGSRLPRKKQKERDGREKGKAQRKMDDWVKTEYD